MYIIYNSIYIYIYIYIIYLSFQISNYPSIHEKVFQSFHENQFQQINKWKMVIHKKLEFNIFRKRSF